MLKEDIILGPDIKDSKNSVAEAIEEYISKNNLKEGDKLPSEREFSKMLSISRTSLREGIRVLQTINVLESKIGKGVYVKNPNYSVNGLNIQAEVTGQNLLQLIQVREALESLSINLAIDNITDEEVEELENTLLKMEQVAKNNTVPQKCDDEFHKIIYSASRNNILVSLLENLLDISRNLWGKTHWSNTILVNSVPLHRPVFEAIKKRNKDEASKAYKALAVYDAKIIKEFETEAKNLK